MALKYGNLTIIGTSHIARQSIDEVKEAIALKPDMVAVELDNSRLNALNRKGKARLRLRDMMRIGITGFVFALIGSWVQKKLGNIVGVSPGTEMLTAVRLARKAGIEVALIDQDINITLARLSRGITWKERLRFPYDLLKAAIFRKSEMRRLGIESLDLTRVPERKMIKALTKELREKYPNVYRVLVSERNNVMANRLSAMMLRNTGRRILAVVGAGHEEELLGLVREKEGSAGIVYEFTVAK